MQCGDCTNASVTAMDKSCAPTSREMGVLSWAALKEGDSKAKEGMVYPLLSCDEDALEGDLLDIVKV